MLCSLFFVLCSSPLKFDLSSSFVLDLGFWVFPLCSASRAWNFLESRFEEGSFYFLLGFIKSVLGFFGFISDFPVLRDIL